jgi:hypothetical protein
MGVKLFLTLKEDNRLRAFLFANRVLRRIFHHKRDEIIRG